MPYDLEVYKVKSKDIEKCEAYLLSMYDKDEDFHKYYLLILDYIIHDIDLFKIKSIGSFVENASYNDISIINSPESIKRVSDIIHTYRNKKNVKKMVVIDGKYHDYINKKIKSHNILANVEILDNNINNNYIYKIEGCPRKIIIEKNKLNDFIDKLKYIENIKILEKSINIDADVEKILDSGDTKWKQ